MAGKKGKKKNSKKSRSGEKKEEDRHSKKKDPLDYIALPTLDLNPETKRAILIVLILTLGALSLIGLFDMGGTAGDYLARGLALAFGFGKWIFPLILLAWGFFLYRKDKGFFKGSHFLGLLLFLVSLQSLFHLFVDTERWAPVADAGRGGGHVGAFLVDIFYNFLGFWGSLLVLVALFIISLLLIFNTTLSRLVGRESILFKILLPVRWSMAQFLNLFRAESEEREEEAEEEDLEEQELPLSQQKSSSETSLFSKKKVKEDSTGEEPSEDGEEQAGKGEAMAQPLSSQKEEEASPVDSNWEPTGITIDLPLNLLNNKTGKPSSGDVRQNSMIIQRTLENFGISVEMGEVEVGPTVAQYTLKPAEGVKLSKITNLGNDLALSLAAHPIRIEAPIPGKPLVGIEVPNRTKAIVSLREILSSKEFKERKSNLMMALGKDVTGDTWIYDITRMPHLLIAGATNSGKSVCVNSIIISLLYQNNPDDIRFIMVDPKRVELPIYNGIPHLLTPVITDVNKTINSLKWCLNEMDRRFEILSKAKKRNIESYNASPNTEKMPYIIFVVDELADLMVAAPREVEAGVIRLTQMARAVGIHLILATQRPSVDVITGLIKANIPARIAFSVASGVDSKTILDAQGAEKLLGQGDMLFVNPDISKPKRIQGVFVSDAEVKRVVNYIKEKSGDFEYVEGVTDKQKVEGMGGGVDSQDKDDERDEFFESAKETVINSGKASASFLQRKLRVGYARAAGLLDELEEAGIVGPANGSKPREILVSQEQYQAMSDDGVTGAETHDRQQSQPPESYLSDEEDSQQHENEEEAGESDDSEEEGASEDTSSEDDDQTQEEDESQDTPEESSESDGEEDEDEDDGLYFAK